MSWYCLQTRPGAENLVSLQLGDKGIEHYYPSRSQKSADGKRLVEQRFFPGYVFSEFLWQNRNPVIQIQHIVRVLGFGLKPSVIPAEQIASIKLMVSTLEPILIEPCAYWIEGARVRMKAGPLRGAIGYIAYVKGKTRLVLSLELLQQSISTEVDASTVELLPEKAAA